MFVGVGGFDDALEVSLRLVVVGFDVGWLLLPRQHFLLVEAVAVVNFLQIKLEFVIVGDGDVRSNEGALVVVEVLSERGEVFVGVPFGVVIFLQFLLGLNVEGTPSVVEVVEDLNRRDVAIRREPMLQLAVVLFVEGIAEVVDDAA